MPSSVRTFSLLNLFAALLLPAVAGAGDPPPPLRIVCLGDSITDGHTYPLMVQAALREAGKPVPVMINAGIAGDYAGGMLQRLECDVFARDPDIVLLLSGVNDWAYKQKLPDYLANMTAIIDRVTAKKIKLVLLTLTPLRKKESQQELAAWSDAIRKLAKDKRVQLADISAVFAPHVAAGEEIWEPDGVHLSFAGYRIMAGGVLVGLGHPDVPVPETIEWQLEPGVIRDWKIRAAADNKPLTKAAAAKLIADKRWTAYKLPEPDPHENWWFDQERERGFALRLDKYVGGPLAPRAEASASPAPQNFLALTTIDSPTSRKVYFRPGAYTRAIWLNGQEIHRPKLNHGWHIQPEIEATLQKGENTILLETGQSFFLSVVEEKL